MAEVAIPIAVLGVMYIISNKDIGFIKLEERDVVRHDVVRKIINAYEKNDKN